MEEILIHVYEFTFGNPYGVTMALDPLTWVGIGSGVISGVASLFGGGAKKRAARRAEERKRVLTGELKILEKNRQTIKNPYAGVTNLSGMAKDLSSMVSNPFANLGVATQAAEIQI
tara:strand:- start:231 stop:578 length:348 start_codon:yes stop_codon:yes gene_type:complete